MVDELRELGSVKLVQLQPKGLIIESPSGSIYDETRRIVVDRLLVTSKGIEATTPDGEHMLDIHHLDHPDKAYSDDDLISIGFTSHYEAMRTQFGDHMVDGSAGENIIIQYDKEIWTDNLGQQIAIENAETGKQMLLDLVSYATPCKEFSHFATNTQDKQFPTDEMKSTLQFLNKGRRGFLLLLTARQEAATIQAGDRVFVTRE